MKGLDRGKKCLQHNIVDLFHGNPNETDRRSFQGQWTYSGNTHTGTQTYTHIHTHIIIIIIIIISLFKVDRIVKYW